MIEDPFSRTTDSPIAPSEYCFAITPDDVQDLPRATKAIYVGQGGDIALVPVRGTSEVIFSNVASGTVLDVRIKAVRLTGTTAADLVGLA